MIVVKNSKSKGDCTKKLSKKIKRGSLKEFEEYGF